MEKRLKLFGSFILIILCIYMIRLAQIDLWTTTSFGKTKENLLKQSVEQRGNAMKVDEGRGHFLYTDGSSMVYEKKDVLIIFPFLKYESINWEQLASILKIPKETIIDQLYFTNEPFVLKYNGTDYILTQKQKNEINDLQIEGLFGIEIHSRIQNRLADHLIGLTGENNEILQKRYPLSHFPNDTLIGLSGLEKSFDYFLINSNKSKLIYYTDGLKRPLFGTTVKYVAPANPMFPLQVLTTIDFQIQSDIEQILINSGINKGGAILLDIQTNDIVATVSLPSINHADPFHSKLGNAKNEMLSEQIIGSVFKPVVTAAAIEKLSLQLNETFDCNKNIFGKPDPNYQYGTLDVTDSFAKSCNNTFGTLAKRLQPIHLEEYAHYLGLIGSISWEGEVFHFPTFKQIREEKGRIFLSTSPKYDNNFLAQTGIGQQEVRATPIGIANMMATIARGGERKSVRVVKEVQYKNGATFFKFPVQKKEDQSISPLTAMKLQLMLKEVVLNGTAKDLKDAIVTIAGKTGTAQLESATSTIPLYNRWMAGYFPYENPKYALVVVSLETPNEYEKVNLIFKKIVNSLF